ncbi:MAG: hypothetical protein ACJ74Y_08310, partial [Bryobacteraceae bacterium]
MTPPLQKEEHGRDQVVYSLLLAFLGLAAVLALGAAKIGLSLLWTNLHVCGSKPGHYWLRSPHLLHDHARTKGSSSAITSENGPR